MGYSATLPFASAGVATTVTRLNQGVENTNEIIAGNEALQRLRLTQLDITTTGSVNDYDPGAVSVVRCNNASALTFTGIDPYASGQILTFLNIGSSTVKFTHQDASSSAANRIIFASAQGQILGPDGSITLEYDATATRWRVASFYPGTPIDVAHSDANFTGAGTDADWGVASGDQLGFAYQQWGDVVDVWWTLATTTVANTPATLRITLPNSFTGAARRDVPCVLVESGTGISAFAFCDSGQTYIAIAKASGNMANTTNLTTASGHLRVQVQ